MHGPYSENDHWLSAHKLCRLGAFQFSANMMRSSPEPCLSTGAPITVIALMDDNKSIHYRTIAMLASIDYDDYEVVAVYDSPKTHEKYAGWIRSYDQVIPFRGIFKPKSQLTVQEAMLAGLQSTKTPYACVVSNGDILHPQSLGRAAAALQSPKIACCRAVGFRMNKAAWVTPYKRSRPDVELMVFDVAVASKLAGLPDTRHDAAWLWKIAWALDDQTRRLSELLYFKSAADYDEECRAAELYFESPYSGEANA